MPGDEYASTGGGSLKLKGVNRSSKITKKKKKKRPKSPESPEAATQSTKHADEDRVEEASKPENNAVAQRGADEQPPVEDDISAHDRGKTEAELRHEERRRRRVWLNRFCRWLTDFLFCS